MRETMDNVRFVHEGDFEPDNVYSAKPLEWFIGRNVKLA